MRAIVIAEPVGPEVLQIGEATGPVAGPGELLVRVRATALNRLDLMQRQGCYPLLPGAPEALGWRWLARWSAGARMCGAGHAGTASAPCCWAAAVPAGMAIPISANLSFEQAAALAEVFLTAYLNHFDLGGLCAPAGAARAGPLNMEVNGAG